MNHEKNLNLLYLAVNKKKTTVTKLLAGLMDNDFVKKTGYGKYAIKNENDKTSESGESGEPDESDKASQQLPAVKGGDQLEVNEKTEPKLIQSGAIPSWIPYQLLPERFEY